MVRLVALVLLTVPLLVTNAVAGELPDHLRESIDKALSTGDTYVHGAVIDYSTKQYPALEDAIQKYVNAFLDGEKKKREEKKKKDRLSGNVTMGLSYSSGNTDREDLRFASAIKYNADGWHNEIKMSARGSKEDDERNAEEYKVKNHTRHEISDTAYASLDLEYVNDRFSGHERRTTETVGYGHYFWKEKGFSLAGQASLGARQIKLTDGSSQNDFVQKLSSEMEWHITDDISFIEDLSVSFTENDVITESDSAFKTMLTEDLALLLVINVEHLSHVPEQRENTDTFTSLNLMYDF